MLCENRKTSLDEDGIEWADWGESCVLIREHDAKEVHEQIAVPKNNLSIEGRTESVVWFLNLAEAVKISKCRKEGLRCAQIWGGEQAVCCSD